MVDGEDVAKRLTELADLREQLDRRTTRAVLAGRRAGMTYRQIALLLRVARGTVQNIERRAAE